jgi:hypothetical protein
MSVLRMIREYMRPFVSISTSFLTTFISHFTAAGPGGAYRTLDSIRAVKQSGSFTGVSATPLTTLWGYSAGASNLEFVSILLRLSRRQSM